MTTPAPDSKVKYPIGVLLMAYGGPASLEEVPGYLADIRAGRTTPKNILAEITNNYRLIGGRSPLLEITCRQAADLSALMEPERVRIYLGMRHWKPWIEDTVAEMLADGVTHAFSLVLAPHYSNLSIAKYQQRIANGLALQRGQIHFEHICAYHTHPKLIQAYNERIQQALNAWEPEQHDAVHIVMSAHSLPERILAQGDPYASQLLETASLVAAQAGLSPERWSWSYQSAGRSPEPWLGPQLPEHLANLAARGIRDVISLPIGFVADHVEILYDIDIQAQATARQLGMRLVRPPSLNTDPLFIQTLADTINTRLEDLGWEMLTDKLRD